MPKLQILHTSDSFVKQFIRCCNEYESLNIAVAWCGNPKRIIPFQHIEDFRGSIKVILGVSLYHTHPEAIVWLKKLGAELRIYRNNLDFYHPKIYLFRHKNRYALFIGSSNLTYAGFYSNIELNTLLEGTISRGTDRDIVTLEKLIEKWHTNEYSLKATPKWIKDYRLRYNANLNKQHKSGAKTPLMTEENSSLTSWLLKANWDTYNNQIIESLTQQGREAEGYHFVLDAADRELSIPWDTGYFRDITKRRIMGGIRRYGWLGHVSVSGKVRSLFATGTNRQWSTIVRAINGIAQLNSPIHWPTLSRHLDSLVNLGLTMKVWGRLLCIVRPDLYCTVASASVRQNLSEILDIPQSQLANPDGYIQAIRFIHESPWFNSVKPKNESEVRIWRRRVAFMDAILY